MAAPLYTWEYVTNLHGLGPPVVTTLEASANLETKVGTLCIMNGGQVDEAGDSTILPIGLAAEAITTAATAADPVKVYILRPGDIIKGTADADASGLSGFNGKLGDFNSDGDLDVADTTNGCASVWKIGSANTEVFITLSKLATF